MPALQKVLGEHLFLECTCPADAPLVWADPQLVRWMLGELVRNARHAMADSDHASISVERVIANQPQPRQAPGANQFTCVVVTNTGRGMDREVQKHLGQPFVTTKAGKSIGLGLASVTGLMKAHGGWLDVTSALGQGTKVRLCFPSAVACPSGKLSPAGMGANHGDKL